MTQEQPHKLLFLTLITTYINPGPPNDEQITDVRSYRGSGMDKVGRSEALVLLPTLVVKN